MKILLTGGEGQLASEIFCEASKHKSVSIKNYSKKSLDITKPIELQKVILNYNPDFIINAAAYTKVDLAESKKKDAYDINKYGVENLASICANLDIPLIHFSTDYVFDGSGIHPWNEEDSTNPLNTYGKTKLAGDEAITNICKKYLIIRTSWVFSNKSNNFVTTILNLAKDQKTIQVISDQWGGPTSTSYIAKTIFEILPKIKNNWGIYNLCQLPYTNWANFAEEIVKIGYKYELINTKPKVEFISSKQYITDAKRPTNSRLDVSKINTLFNLKPYSWKESLLDMLNDFQF